MKESVLEGKMLNQLLHQIDVSETSSYKNGKIVVYNKYVHENNKERKTISEKQLIYI